LHHDNALSDNSFSSREFLTKKSMTTISHPLYFSLFPQLNIKLRNINFDLVDAMEAESQAVLNTIREHDFQDAFKKRAKSL
jgi:hypothetical protein